MGQRQNVLNIFVLTYEGRVIVRPDTTWVRKYEDFFVPDFVGSLSISDVLAAKVSRPGKCIAERFAERYFEQMGEGLLFYPDNLLDGSEQGYAEAMCLGHTAYVPMPEAAKETFTQEERASMRKAFVAVSRMCIIRNGDIVAVETAKRRPLGDRSDGNVEVSKGEHSFSVIF